MSLLGIAQRTVSIEFGPEIERKRKEKPLISGAKTVGDWICAGRAAHNLARHHVAEKMGIASALVAAWEKGAEQPSGRQVEALRELFKEGPLPQPT